MTAPTIGTLVRAPRQHGRGPATTDASFIANIVRSDLVVTQVAVGLLLAGLAVTKPFLAVRPERRLAAAYNDGGVDLSVGPYPIQVKERLGYDFTGPHDFRYSTIWVDTEAGFARYRPLVYAYILVSPARLGLIVVPRRAFPVVVVETDPRTRRAMVAVPIEATWTIQQFVEAALARSECRR